MQALFNNYRNSSKPKDYCAQNLMGIDNYKKYLEMTTLANEYEEQGNSRKAAEISLLAGAFALKNSNFDNPNQRMFLLKNCVLPNYALGHYYYYQKLISSEDNSSIEDFRQALIISIRYAALNIEAGNAELWYTSNFEYIAKLCEALALKHADHHNVVSNVLFELLDQPEYSGINPQLQNDIFRQAQAYSKPLEYYAGKRLEVCKSTLRRRKPIKFSS